MKQARLSLVLVVTLLALGAMLVRAEEDTKTNPYESIAVRNPFQLKDPPPPVSAEDLNKAPPPPLATVELTGVVNMLSKKLALLEIVPGPGKPPIKETFEEGTRKDTVEVLLIDVDEGLVKIKNGDVITNIALKTPAKQPTGPGVPVPGVQPGIPTPGLLPNATAGLPTVNPTLANPNNPNNAASPYNRGNVMVVGGSPTPANPASPTAVSPIAKPYYGNAVAPATGLQGYGAAPGAGNSGVTVTGGGDGSARTIPTRPIRNAQPQAATMDPAEQYYKWAVQEQNAKAKGIPMPPLPPLPPN